MALHWYDLLALIALGLLLFGPKRLPEMGASLGKTIREFQKSMREVTNPQPPTSLPPSAQAAQAAQPVATAAAAPAIAAAAPDAPTAEASEAATAAAPVEAPLEAVVDVAEQPAASAAEPATPLAEEGAVH